MPATLIPADMAVSVKFSVFNLVDIDYKHVNGTPIPATILVPKAIKSGKHPVLVRWHGGCFITGHRMYPEWLGTWILELALANNAIIITPDYRLMPEANGLDIQSDVRDLFKWLVKTDNLDACLPAGVKADVDNMLVTGESAGGWLALHSSYLPENRQRVRAVIAHYPMIDLRNQYYTDNYEKQIFTPVAPQLDRAILAGYLADMKNDATITSATPPDRVPLVISALQQGAFARFFGNDSSLYPLEVLDGISRLPPTWILHGTGDTVIPVDGTYKYEKKVREMFPNAKLHVHYDEGSDHGFDNAEGISMSTGWVEQGLGFISTYWPARQPADSFQYLSQ